MTDSENSAATEPQTPQFALQKIYVKDVSFETPNSPDVFTQEWKPDVNIELNTSGKRITDDLHEVVLGITVTAKLSEETAFLVEVQQAGIFTIIGYSKQDMDGMLGSYCPNVLFPYARETISDLITRGGFPQLLLSPVNFDAIYQEHLSKKAASQAADDKEEVKVH